MKAKQTYLELAKEINDILSEFKLPKSKITNCVTDGGSAFCKAFKEYGKGNDMLVETIQFDECNEIDDNEETSQGSSETLPYMQNEDGELYYSNSLNFEQDLGNDNINSFEDGTDVENDELELFEDLMPSEQSDSSTENAKIDLPPQRRSLSHLLNLVSSDFLKALPVLAKTAFVNAYNKLHALWIFTHRSSHARAICEKINELLAEITKEIKGASHIQSVTANDWAVLNEYLKVMAPLNRLQSEYNGSQGLIMPTLMSMRYHINALEGSNLLSSFKKVMLDK